MKNNKPSNLMRAAIAAYHLCEEKHWDDCCAFQSGEPGVFSGQDWGRKAQKIWL